MKRLAYPVFFALLLFAGSTSAQPDYTVKGKVFTSLEKALAQPDSVVRIKLRRKGYKEIPPEIFQLKNLKELDLGNNKITFISSNIKSLQNLEIIRMERNRLISVPKEIGDVKSLRYIDLGLNKITFLPDEISKLENLEFLQIWGNEITVLPESARKLEKLKWLDMRAIILTTTEREDVEGLFPGANVLLSPDCNCGK